MTLAKHTPKAASTASITPAAVVGEEVVEGWLRAEGKVRGPLFYPATSSAPSSLAQCITAVAPAASRAVVAKPSGTPLSHESQHYAKKKKPVNSNIQRFIPLA